HDDAATAERARERDQLREICACRPLALGVWVDEPSAIPAADRGHRDPAARGLTRGGDGLDRKLDRLESEALRAGEALAHVAARRELVLQRETHATGHATSVRDVLMRRRSVARSTGRPTPRCARS